MVGPLERRRVAKPSLARAFEDAEALIVALLLSVANTLIHRDLTGELPAAVLQLLLLELTRTASGQQNEAAQSEPAHEGLMPEARAAD
jgi:hypothetical protein